MNDFGFCLEATNYKIQETVTSYFQRQGIVTHKECEPSESSMLDYMYFYLPSLRHVLHYGNPDLEGWISWHLGHTLFRHE